MKIVEGVVLTVDSKMRQFPTGIEYKIIYPDNLGTQITYQLLIEDFEKNIEQCKKVGID